MSSGNHKVFLGLGEWCRRGPPEIARTNANTFGRQKKCPAARGRRILQRKTYIDEKIIKLSSLR
jgi:hypothetical protein